MTTNQDPRSSNAATVVGVFEDQLRARQAIEELRAAGFSDKQIGFISHDREKGHANTASEGTTGSSEAARAGTGAVAGGALGGILGAAAALLIPGVGPIIAGGILGATVGGVVIGAAAGGLIGALTKIGVPEEEAHYYNQEFEAGRTIVTVKAPERSEEARAILRRNGGYDSTSRAGTTTPAYATNQQASNAYSTGTASGQPQAGDYTTASPDQGQRMQLREEQLQANKQTVEKGQVQLGKDVVSEERTLDVPVTHEEVYVERRPGSGEVSDRPINAGNETYNVPVYEEQVNVQKTPVVREEVEMGRRSVQENQQVRGTVRREEARIDREGTADIQADPTDNTAQ